MQLDMVRPAPCISLNLGVFMDTVIKSLIGFTKDSIPVYKYSGDPINEVRGIHLSNPLRFLSSKRKIHVIENNERDGFRIIENDKLISYIIGNEPSCQNLLQHLKKAKLYESIIVERSLNKKLNRASYTFKCSAFKIEIKGNVAYLESVVKLFELVTRKSFIIKNRRPGDK